MASDPSISIRWEATQTTITKRSDGTQVAEQAPASIQDILLQFGEWLDSQGVIVSDKAGDPRSHDELARDFLKERGRSHTTDTLEQIEDGSARPE